MGFIKAFSGALGGSFADQWKDYYTPIADVPATAGVFPAVPSGTNAGRGANTKGSQNIITNGSKIIVPEGMALVTLLLNSHGKDLSLVVNLLVNNLLSMLI